MGEPDYLEIRYPRCGNTFCQPKRQAAPKRSHSRIGLQTFAPDFYKHSAPSPRLVGLCVFPLASRTTTQDLVSALHRAGWAHQIRCAYVPRPLHGHTRKHRQGFLYLSSETLEEAVGGSRAELVDCLEPLAGGALRVRPADMSFEDFCKKSRACRIRKRTHRPVLNEDHFPARLLCWAGTGKDCAMPGFPFVKNGYSL